MIRGENDYGFFFNGLYQDLAYLYAAKGNSDNGLAMHGYAAEIQPE